MEQREVFLLSFSGGWTSAYMTDHLLREPPAGEVIICFANTEKKEPATLDFVHQCDGGGPKQKGGAEKECWDVWLPLVDWKITKPDVLQYWRRMPFDLQLKNHEGSCDLCFLKGKGKIKRILTEHPEKADWWMAQEAAVGATFHKQYSYELLLQAIRQTPTLFDYDDEDFPCFCNTD